MQTRRRSYEMDFLNGPILPKILMFSLPLMLSSVLQLSYNVTNVIVVGRFEGRVALGAVGSTGSLTNLLINLFIGLSIGANVVIAKHSGAGRYKDASEAVHTSVAISLICGFAIGIIGFFSCEQLLVLMGTPEDVLPLATVYMRIYFIGMPFNMLYNFGAAILRSIGDTRRPLYYLIVSGLINVALNLLFVIQFHMGVAGVALATIIAQLVSAVLIFLCLIRSDGVIHVDIRKLRISASKLRDITVIGLPAGMQGVFFAFSNVLIQSTVNSFGSIVVAGNSTSANIENFVYVSMNAVYQATITMTSQNLGARKYKRVRQVCVQSVLAVTVIGVILCGLALLFSRALFSLFINIQKEPEVFAYGAMRLGIICSAYYLCGIMDVLCGALRGLGSTLVPMIVSLLGACAFRILWVVAIFPLSPTLQTLYISYPISWVITAVVHGLCYLHLVKRYPVSAGID